MGSYFDMLKFAGDEASGAEAVAKVAAKVVPPSEQPREEGEDYYGGGGGGGRGRPQLLIGRNQGVGFQGGRGSGDSRVLYEAVAKVVPPSEPKKQQQQQQPCQEGEDYYGGGGGCGRPQLLIGRNQGVGFQGGRGSGDSRVLYEAVAEVVPPSEPKKQQQQPRQEREDYYRGGGGRGRPQLLIGGNQGVGFQGGRGSADSRVLYDADGYRHCENSGNRGYSSGNRGYNSAYKKSEGDAAKDEMNPNSKSLSGSAKRRLKKKKPMKEDSNDGDASQKTIDNEPEEMTLDEYEKKLGKKKSPEPSYTIEQLSMKFLGARLPPVLHRTGVVDGALLRTLEDLGLSLDPECIYRKRLSVNDRHMAKRHMGEAKHGVRFPLAKILTEEEETRALVGLQATAYDRSGRSFVVQCKKLSSCEDTYRVTSGWGDFLTANKLDLQPDAKPEEEEVIMFEMWAFRSPALVVGVRNQPEGSLGLVVVHYYPGESSHGDDLIAELAAAGSRRIPELDETGITEMEALVGFLMFARGD